VNLKSFNKKLMKINSLGLQKALITTLQEHIKRYVEKMVPRFRVGDLDFFIMMQRLSYATSEQVSQFFGHHELWLDLVRCIGNYPTTNMMHIEVVKIIRNGVRHKLAVCPQLSGGVKNIVNLLTAEFERER
jgi:hypothetical protein